MKLEDFAKQTLLDITNGVAEAQHSTELYIAPGIVENRKLTSAQMVKFEGAVTVSKEAGGGLRVWTLGDFKAGGSSEQTNRISFEVPVYFQAPTERNQLHFSKRKKKS